MRIFGNLRETYRRVWLEVEDSIDDYIEMFLHHMRDDVERGVGDPKHERAIAVTIERYLCDEIGDSMYGGFNIRA